MKETNASQIYVLNVDRLVQTIESTGALDKAALSKVAWRWL